MGRPASYHAGDEVEVKMPIKGFAGAWYEAHVDSRLDGKLYLVVYTSLLDDADPSQPLRESVRTSQMRRRPPLGRGPYALHQRVEAFHNDGWWPGVVSKRPKKSETWVYTVWFPDTKEEIRFKPTLIRPCLRWVEGAWVRDEELPPNKSMSSQRLGGGKSVTSTKPSYTLQSIRACDNKTRSKLHTDVVNTDTENPVGSALTAQLCKKAKREGTKEDTTRSADSLGGCPASSSQGFDGTMSKTLLLSKDSSERKHVFKRRKKTVQRKGSYEKSGIIRTKVSTQGNSESDQQESIMVNVPLSVVCSTLKTKLGNGDTAIKSLDEYELSNMMVDIPCSSLFGTPNSQRQHDEAEMGRLNQALGIAGNSECDQQESILVNVPLSVVHSTLKTKLGNEGDTAIHSMDEYVLSNMMADIPSPSLFGTQNSQHQHDEAEMGRVNQALFSTPRVEIAGKLIASSSSESPLEKKSLPFEKRSPMWKYLDMEVLPKMRQHPHFQPLEQSPEVQREGMAVGLMVTYHNLMDSKGCLRMDSSLHNWDESMKIVNELEEHGFEVQHLRAHLEELLRIKNNHEQFSQKKSAIEMQVLEIEEKRDHLNIELKVTDKAVMALKTVLSHFHERRTSLSKQKEEYDTMIAKFHTDLRVSEEKLVSSERTFQDLLTAVW